MAPNPTCGAAPDLHIASLVSDLEASTNRFSDTMSRLIEQFNLLGIRFLFDAPTLGAASPQPSSALDNIYRSARTVQSNVDRLEQIERTLRDSLTQHNVPVPNATGYR